MPQVAVILKAYLPLESNGHDSPGVMFITINYLTHDLLSVWRLQQWFRVFLYTSSRSTTLEHSLTPAHNTLLDTRSSMRVSHLYVYKVAACSFVVNRQANASIPTNLSKSVRSRRGDSMRWDASSLKETHSSNLLRAF